MPRLLLLAIVTLSACQALSAAAAEKYWNQFRGADGTGHAEATGLPEKFSDSENVKWKTPVEGKAWSSPVVWKKQVWMTNATPEGNKLWAVCLDLDTGKVVHNPLVFEIAKPMFCYPMNSYGTPTPAVEEGRVYVSFGSAGTACLDTQTGKTLWSRQDLKCDHFRGPASSPVIYGDLILLQFDGFDVQFVVALDKKTGDTKWKKDRAFDYRTTNGDNKKAYGTPSIFQLAGRDVAICPAAVATEAFDPKNGELLWTVRTEGMNASARPLLGNGLLYLTNGMGRIVAIKPAGSGDITSEAIAWSSTKGVAKRASPILVEDLLYMVSDEGIATCTEAKTGNQLWSQRLGGEFAASPVYADGKLFFSGINGDVTVVKPGRTYQLLAKNTFPEGFMATPAVAENSLILRTKSAVYRIGK